MDIWGTPNDELLYYEFMIKILIIKVQIWLNGERQGDWGVGGGGRGGQLCRGRR